MCTKKRVAAALAVLGVLAVAAAVAVWRTSSASTTTSYNTLPTAAPVTSTTTTDPYKDWIVIQRRTVGDVSFARPWADYKAGFGNESGDLWLGNDQIHQLCPPARPCQLSVEVTYPENPWYFEYFYLPSHPKHLPIQPDGRYHALYGRFAVTDSQDYYRLTIGQFNDTASTAGDYLTWVHGEGFSTLDADHDPWHDGSCSERYGGQAGWWFGGNCGYSLNGVWGAGMVWNPVTGMESATASRLLVWPEA